MIETFALGDQVVLKKPHACGENLWEIVRVGADVKLKCSGCERVNFVDISIFMANAESQGTILRYRQCLLINVPGLTLVQRVFPFDLITVIVKNSSHRHSAVSQLIF